MKRWSSEERRTYMAEWRAKRRAFAYEQLGGECVRCGSEDRLEFDHIDPATKVQAVTYFLHRSKASFEAELAKCQLLCHEHHREKTVAEGSTGGRLTKPIRHGTLWAYDGRGCRCDECKEAKRSSRLR